MQKLTIVSPAYQEAETLRVFYEALVSVINTLQGYDVTILFVVDRCADATFSIAADIARIDSRVGVLHLSSRFGHQTALIAGIDHADADVIIMMDSDLQHPPSVIPRLLAAYEAGNDVVYTLRGDSKDVGFLRRIAGRVFYWFVNLISDVPINRNTSDFRLISSRVADILRTHIRERNIFLRGIISWVGFNQTSIVFKADKRFAGKSKYSFNRLINFALFGIISFSKKPLRAATLVGLLFSVFGFGFALLTVFQYFINNQLPPGWATVVVLVSIFGGVQLFFLGIIGEYIGGIFDEVKARPRYIVEEAINVSVAE